MWNNTREAVTRTRDFPQWRTSAARSASEQLTRSRLFSSSEAWLRTNDEHSRRTFDDNPPLLLAEELRESPPPPDYKFLRFDGGPETVIVYSDFSSELRRSFMSLEWEMINGMRVPMCPPQAVLDSTLPPSTQPSGDFRHAPFPWILRSPTPQQPSAPRPQNWRRSRFFEKEAW